MSGLSNEEVERRVPAWCALSELFLDVDLQPADFARIAKAISDAGIPFEEAKKILEQEVAPAFTPNLLSAAGDWAGWTDEFVKKRVLAHLNGGVTQRAIAKARTHRHRTLYISAWQEVARRLAQIQHAE